MGAFLQVLIISQCMITICIILKWLYLCGKNSYLGLRLSEKAVRKTNWVNLREEQDKLHSWVRGVRLYTAFTPMDGYFKVD